GSAQRAARSSSSERHSAHRRRCSSAAARAAPESSRRAYADSAFSSRWSTGARCYATAAATRRVRHDAGPPMVAPNPDLLEPARARARSALAALGDIGVEPEPFAQSLAERAASQEDPPAALERLFSEDLALAFACGRGSRPAMERFERAYGGEIDRAFRRMNAGALQLSDVRQQVLEKLFVGERPKILDYSGQGPLRVWLRVAALRLLTNLVTRGP